MVWGVELTGKYVAIDAFDAAGSSCIVRSKKILVDCSSLEDVSIRGKFFFSKLLTIPHAC